MPHFVRWAMAKGRIQACVLGVKAEFEARLQEEMKLNQAIAENLQRIKP